MEMIKDCGWMSYMMILLGIFAVLFGIVALALGFFKPRWGMFLGVFALVASCSVPSAGVFGTMHGRSITEGAISGESVSPEMKERIRKVGYAEAQTCTTLGGFIGALPIVLALAALGIGAARRKKSQS